MKNKTPKLKTAASITIYGADKMTLKGRRDIAHWMREQADFLVRYGDEYDYRVQSRYLYTP
jgi:hypothetical protein